MHVTKNKLVDLGALGTDLRVPLILGVWRAPGLAPGPLCCVPLLRHCSLPSV